MIAFDETAQATNITAKIKVIGVGGAGNNTINSMFKHEYDSSIEFIVANTDYQALNNSQTKKQIQLGTKLTKGLGSGANPDIGRRAAEEDLDKIIETVNGADIVFLAAGMGGGTGSGALPVIAKALREHNILTIAIVTKPFMFEGKKREKVALEAINKLQKNVDTLVVIPNQKLLDLVGEDIPMVEAFEMINDILYQSVKGISYIITKSGHINVDFADLKVIMKDMGRAVMGTGRASGVNRAIQATREAISSPLLENMSIEGAKGVLLNISGGPTLSLQEIHEAASVIYEQADENSNIILGSVIDPDMNDEVIVTVIATGCINCEENTADTDHNDQELVVNETNSKTIQASIRDEEIKEHIEEKPAEHKIEFADLSNLDVPTFLRKELVESGN